MAEYEKIKRDYEHISRIKQELEIDFKNKIKQFDIRHNEMNLMLEKTLRELEECKTKGIRYDEVKRKADEYQQKYEKSAEKLEQITKLYQTQKDEFERLSIHDRDVTQTVELLQKDKVDSFIILPIFIDVSHKTSGNIKRKNK